MAIAVSTNPFFIDAISAVALVTKPFSVVKIRWTSAALNDTAVLQDQNGNPLWQASQDVALKKDESDWSPDRPLMFNGLKVPTLGSGTIMIYTKENDPV